MRFAIIGAGAIAHLRKAAIDRLADAELSGVHDIAADRAAALAGNGRVFTSPADVFDAADVDAVIVCTPPNTHEDIAVRALEAGKHVLVEKPMANTLEGCRNMIEAARRNKRTLTVGFNHRYFPAIRDLNAAIRSGRIGRLSHIRGYTGHTGLSEFKADWMYSKDVMGGGALLDNGIHMIDLVQHVMGPVKGVYGCATGNVWELDRVEDNAFALLTGKDGVIGSLSASWDEWKGYHFYVEAYGTRGMARAYYAPMKSEIITMDRPGGPSKKTTNYYLPLIFREKFRGWQSTAIATLAEELTDFIALAAGQTPAGPIATAEDGYRAIEIANAVYDSTRSEQMTKLAETV